MLNVNRYELDQDLQSYLLGSDEEIPDAPESWSLEDFGDLLIQNDYGLQDYGLQDYELQDYELH